MLHPNGPLFEEAGAGSGGGSLLGSDKGSQQTVTSLPGDPTKFRDLMADEWKGHTALKDYQDINALAKSHVNLQKMLGGEKIPAPKADWTEDQWNEFHSRMGRPAKPEDYGIKFPEGYTPSENLVKTVVGAMHKAGMSTKQANDVVKAFVDADLGSAKELAANREKAAMDAEVGLRKEFGDKFDEKLRFARYALSELGDKGTIETIEEMGLGSNPALVKLLSRTGELLAGDRSHGGNSGSGGNDEKLSPDQALAEINSMIQDKSKMDILHDSSHPQHDVLIQRRLKLYRMAYPQESES